MKNEHLAYMIVKLLADDQNTIPYRPPIARIYREHGNRAPINATIFLQQAIYWWAREWPKHPSFTPFYKFNMPSSHSHYRPGDSWIEELQMTKKEFLTARSKIGLKKRQQVPLAQARALAANPRNGNLPRPVIFWTNANRLTYYTICLPALLLILDAAYPNKEETMLLEEPAMLNPERVFSKIPKGDLPKSRKGIYLNPERGFRITETTAETTPEITHQQQSVAEVAELLSNFGITEPAVSDPTLLSIHPDDVRAWIWYTKTQHGLTSPAGFLIHKLRRGQNPPLKFRLLSDLPQEALTWLTEHEHLQGRLDDNIDLPSGLDIELANLWFRIHNKEDE